MSNLINPLVSNPLLPAKDNIIMPTIELPSEVQPLLKPNMMAQLEINTTMGQGKIPANLKFDGQSFDVFVTETFLNAIKTSTTGSFISLPLRVNSAGQLQILSHETLSQSEFIQQQIPNNPLANIHAEPLKVGAFIDAKLKELQVPENIRQQVVSDIASLEISLSLKGDISPAAKMLQPINDILTQLASRPQDIAILKPELLQKINDLLGQTIEGEVSSRVNDITTLKTPLGETMFSSKVKLPLNEILSVTLESQSLSFSKELKFLDSVLKFVLPSSGKSPSIKPEYVNEQPALQRLVALEAHVPQTVFNIALAKLPFSGSNLLENMYNFYQGATTQNISRWLGKNAVNEISTGTEKANQSINELNNFMSSSLKETPSWRIVEMPLFDGNQFAPLKIAVKKDEKDKNKPNQDKTGTRFIVETTFSKLGDFQFDGFANATKRNFDLIIRTSKQMDDDFCSHVINLFKNSLYNLEYVGTVKINRQESFINLQEENTITEGVYI